MTILCTPHPVTHPSRISVALYWSAGNLPGKAVSPVDTRALSWLALARGCLDAQRLASSAPATWDAAAFTATAWSLAVQPPFAAAWRQLSVQVSGGGVEAGSAALHCHDSEHLQVDQGADASTTCRMQVLHCSVPLTELPAAINGAVVGLTVGPQQQLPSYHHTLSVLADAAPHPCLGLGIVRSLDSKLGLIYLLTPLSEAELQHVNVLQVR